MQSKSPFRSLLLVLFIVAIVGGLYYLTPHKPIPPTPGPTPEPSPEPWPPLHAEQIRSGINEFLGKGYKGYDKYANSDSCTFALFDLIDEKHVDVQDGTGWTGRFATGETKTEFYDEFFGAASFEGTYDGFSGEITGSFNSKALRNRENSFATANNTITYYRLTLLETAPIKEEVQADLMEMDPEALFDKYGTHYLQSIYIGGRVNFSSYVNRVTVKDEFKMEAAMKASYGKVVSGSASGGTENKKAVDEVTANKTIMVKGGDPAYAAKIMDGVGEPSDNYEKWSTSITDYMTISDIADKGMVPIYMLVQDPTRRAELEPAWTAYMEAHTDDVLKEGEPEVVTKSSKFLLKEKDGGRYVGIAPYHWNWSYYYPSVANEGVTLKFDSGSDDLEDKNIVRITTTETFKQNWKDYIYLGAFKLKDNLYYWEPYGAKTNWAIERVVPGSDKRIRFGDEIMIKNVHFKQYLQPANNEFLTTREDSYKWTVMPIPEEKEE